MTDVNLHSLKNENLVRQTEQLLLTLPKREELTLRLRFGHSGGREHTFREIAQALGYSVSSVYRFEVQALRRLRHPTRSAIRASHSVTPLIQDVQFVIEKIEMLTPELIRHLKTNQHDLDRIKWDVFQHLVGEFLKSQDFDDVRIVGRNPATSADLYAAKTLSPDGLLIRVFVEVKRGADQVGIEVIN